MSTPPIIYLWELSRFIMQMLTCSEVKDANNNTILQCPIQSGGGDWNIDQAAKLAIRDAAPYIAELREAQNELNQNNMGIRINAQPPLDVRVTTNTGTITYSLNPKNWGRQGYGDLEVFLLAHWLTYIYNYQKPASKVWENLYPIMFIIAHEYMTSQQTPQQILGKYSNPNNKRWQLGNLQFSHHHEKNHKLYKKVSNTLNNLLNYNRSLVSYLNNGFTQIVGNNQQMQQDWIRIIAYLLYNLVYGNPGRIRGWLNTGRGYTYQGNKMLWAALKDYVFFGPILTCIITYKLQSLSQPNQTLLRGFKRILNTLTSCRCPDTLTLPDMEQLELPGDTWNDKLLRLIGIIHREGLRGYYNNNVNSLRSRGLYPIHLDASFFGKESMLKVARILIYGHIGAYRNFVRFACLHIGNRIPRSRKICPLIGLLTGEPVLCPFSDLGECPLFCWYNARKGRYEQTETGRLADVKCKKRSGRSVRGSESLEAGGA